jgi:hypothetical protein
LTALGRHAEAQELLLANLAAPEIDPQLRRLTLGALVELKEAWGRTEEAERHRRELAAMDAN